MEPICPFELVSDVWLNIEHLEGFNRPHHSLLLCLMKEISVQTVSVDIYIACWNLKHQLSMEQGK